MLSSLAAGLLYGGHSLQEVQALSKDLKVLDLTETNTPTPLEADPHILIVGEDRTAIRGAMERLNEVGIQAMLEPTPPPPKLDPSIFAISSSNYDPGDTVWQRPDTPNPRGSWDQNGFNRKVNKRRAKAKAAKKARKRGRRK